MPQALSKAVDTRQVRELREADSEVRMIDVRTPGEFTSAHIPGSCNVQLGPLRERRSELTAQHTGGLLEALTGPGPRAELRARSRR